MVGRLCPESGLKCFSALFWVTAVWQLLAFSHNSMRIPCAGSCRGLWDVVDGKPATATQSWTALGSAESLMNWGQQSQTFQYSHLWNNLYETLISHGLQQISFLLVQRMVRVHDYENSSVGMQLVLTPPYKYHMLPSVKDCLIALVGAYSFWFGEDSHCWYPTVGIHRLQKVLFPAPWRFNSVLVGMCYSSSPLSRLL